jgi:CheY-like chemotaxis protein
MVSLVSHRIASPGRARMAGEIDGAGRRSGTRLPDCSEPVEARPEPSGRLRRLLIVDADLTLFELLQEWLAGQGCQLDRGCTGGDIPCQNYDLIIVDVPYPRQRGASAMDRIACAHRGTPILAVSSAFYAANEGSGAVARALGVAGVLAKPLRREALIGAVGRLIAAAS